MVERKNLELSVRDFGPIARADIDLRPMTVFVGPSNTGKSYLAILIYALHRFDFPVINLVGFDPSGVREEHIGDLVNWLDEISSQLDRDDFFSEVEDVTAPDSINSLIRHYLRGTEKSGNFLLHSEISRCFGMGEDTGRLVRHPGRGSAKVSVKRNSSYQFESTECLKYEFVLNQKGTEFTVSIPDNIPLLFERIGSEATIRLSRSALGVRSVVNQSEFSSDRERQKFFIVSELVGLAGHHLYHPLSRMSHYLPADRAGVMHSYRVAVSSLIERAAYPGIPGLQGSPGLSGVIADFLRQLTELDSSVNTWGGSLENGGGLPARIERKMLKGSVRFENSITGYPVFSYQPHGWKEDMPLMNTSSMVSELVPVVLYLRHVVRSGETLIIEEPESHLHPAMQVEFTRQLAAVVRAGVRVIITTHSEWVLDELANLVRVSELPESRREGIGGADYALTPEQLGVWLFEPKRRPRGSVVKEIPFDEEFGGFRSGFDEVSMRTYNDYAAISNRMERSGA